MAREERHAWRLPAILLLLICALLALRQPYFGGDMPEYTATTAAFADHGSLDIRLADIARTEKLAPPLAHAFDIIKEDIRAGKRDVYPAFARGRDGRVYAIHFFGYPLLAALPFKLFEAAGAPPFKAFQVVNYAALLALGLALRRLFRADLKALAGLALFLACGGVLYLDQTSPEFFSAACLLAGLILFLTGAPRAGGVLGGLAAMQNPTIVFFFAFAPLIKMAVERQLRVLTRADLQGLAAGAAIFALPPLFNLAEYGVPNLIVKRFSDPGLMSGVRLLSFYFDLNQGMILALPGVVAVLAWWGWQRQRLVLAACLAFTLALAVPTLAVLNWNSGAAGIMRYALWAEAPILLALLLRLRAAGRWPAGIVVFLALAQGVAMWHASGYSYIEFSPLARRVLA